MRNARHPGSGSKRVLRYGACCLSVIKNDLRDAHASPTSAKRDRVESRPDFPLKTGLAKTPRNRRFLPTFQGSTKADCHRRQHHRSDRHPWCRNSQEIRKFQWQRRSSPPSGSIFVRETFSFSIPTEIQNLAPRGANNHFVTHPDLNSRS